MFETSESAPATRLRDCRQDALCLLEEMKERLAEASERTELIKEAAEETLKCLQEACERLRDGCPVLFGPPAPPVDEQCQCWRCVNDYDPPFDFGDPFEGSDAGCECGCQGARE